MSTYLRPAIALLLFFTVLTGIVYPLAITGAAQALFPAQANGSQVNLGGRLVGSALIGQVFERDDYFHGRPSAVNYDAATSSGSNLAPGSKVLLGDLAERAAAYGDAAIPADLITASGSGLDPDLSPAGALAQVSRIATARNLGEDVLRRLVASETRGAELGIFGEPRVKVLALNLALDGLKP